MTASQQAADVARIEADRGKAWDIAGGGSGPHVQGVRADQILHWVQEARAAAHAAGRAEMREEAAKVMCHDCHKGLPFNSDGQHIVTERSGNRYPRDCASWEIRALPDASTDGRG